MRIAHCELVRRARDYGDGERKLRDDQSVCWRVVYVRGIDIRGHHIFEQGNLFGVVIRSIVAF